MFAQVLAMFDEDEDEHGVTGDLDLKRYSKADGSHVPLTVLKNRLRKNLGRFMSAVAVCAVVRVKDPSWVAPMIRAARLLGEWRVVYDSTQSARTRAQQEVDAIGCLAKGGRLLVVGAIDGGVPHRLLGAADMIVDIDRLTVADLAKAIRVSTGGGARGLVEADVVGLDLIDAMAAVRASSTAASCLRRLRAVGGRIVVDPTIADVPLLGDLRGYGEAAAWADRLIADLDRWRKGEIAFSAIQKNIVLSGSPGVGKTTFVRSLARTAGLPLLSSSLGKMFANSAGYLDSIVKEIDGLFAEARAAGPVSIVFLDEIEALPSRTNLDSRNGAWWTPVINHFLTVLDASNSSAASSCIVVAATNFPQKLDPALTRSGRLDRVVHIPLPTEDDLAHIYRQHLGGDLKDEDLSAAAALSLGSTGADVEGRVRSARARARAAGRPMGMSDLMREICPAVQMEPHVLLRTAIHEAGHAVLANDLGRCEVKSIAITGNGEGEVRLTVPTSTIGSIESYRDVVVQLLAGRAAEDVLIGSPSAGAGGAPDSDLARATAIVAGLRLSWGLGGSLVYIAAPGDALEVARRDPSMMRAIDKDLSLLYDTAKDLVRQREKAISAVARRLMQVRAMSGAQFLNVLSLEEREAGRLTNA